MTSQPEDIPLQTRPSLQQNGNGRVGGPHEEGDKLMQYLASFVATLGALSAGTMLAWTAPMLSQLQAEDSFLPITEEEGSWVASLMTIGALVGSIPAGIVTNRIGRKGSMLVLAVPCVLSWLLVLFASNVGMLYAARFIGGVATGATSVAAPMYCNEIAEPSIRGAVGTFFQLQITIGILVTFIVGGYASYTVLAIVGLIVPVVWFGLVMLMPETPVFLMMKGNQQAAKRALRRVRGPTYRGIDGEVSAIQQDLDAAAESDTSFLQLFSNRGVVKALIICLGLMVFQQVSGINAVMFYSTIIFEKAGSTLPAVIATIIVGGVQMVFTGVASVLVECSGRRPLLLASAAVMSVAHIGLGAYSYMGDTGTDVSSLGWLPLVCVVLFVIMFSIAFGPIPWMMAGELFPNDVKAPATTIAASLNWSMAFIVTKIFPSMMSGLTVAGTFWAFGGCCVLATIFVFTLVFETKGRSQAEIQDILNGGKR